MEIETTAIPPEELALFRQLKGLEVIFDVGARVDTDYLEIWPDSEHHLFEPNPLFFEELKRKTEGKVNVYVNACGLGKEEGLKGYNEQYQAFIGSGSCSEYAESNLTLPIKTLDRYIRERAVTRIDFLKMDTEGHEMNVLLGGTNWLHIIKLIQYEHWGEPNNRMIKALLIDFDCYDVGYRNVLCMSRTLVNDEERETLRQYIESNNLNQLV